MRRAIVLLLGCLLLVSGCASAAEPLRIMVPTVAGGGYDVTARTAAVLAQRSGVVSDRIPVFNVDGDGGAVALRRLLAERGNAGLVMMMGLGVVGATVTNPGSDLVHDIGELVATWRGDPARVTVGGGSALGGPDHLMLMRLAEAAGVDPAQLRYRTFDGGGALLPALLDGTIDVGVSSVVEYAAQISSGQLRVLAVSGPARMTGVAAPTLTEAGFDVVFVNWRGVLAPPGISVAERDRLVRLLQRLEQTPEWGAAVQRAGWTNAFLPADEFGAFLAEQDRDVRASLARLDLP